MAETEKPHAEEEPSFFVGAAPVFCNEEDQRNEREIAAMVEKAFNCVMHHYGFFSPIDWWAEPLSGPYKGRMGALLELKARTHDTKRFKTVYLNFRKWLSLTLGAIGADVPAIFVVRFTDETRWVRVASIDASKHVIGGGFRIVKSQNDFEPVVEVPVDDMTLLRAAP